MNAFFKSKCVQCCIVNNVNIFNDLLMTSLSQNHVTIFKQFREAAKNRNSFFWWPDPCGLPLPSLSGRAIKKKKIAASLTGYEN